MNTTHRNPPRRPLCGFCRFCSLLTTRSLKGAPHDHQSGNEQEIEDFLVHIVTNAGPDGLTDDDCRAAAANFSEMVTAAAIVRGYSRGELSLSWSPDEHDFILHAANRRQAA